MVAVQKKNKTNIAHGRKDLALEQRELAKAGMVSSLGTLFLTGFLRFKGSGMIHTWAGWALLGFSIWHHFLSTPKPKTLSKDN
jgi:thiosulfate reductase cytochrome b subunit